MRFSVGAALGVAAACVAAALGVAKLEDDGLGLFRRARVAADAFPDDLLTGPLLAGDVVEPDAARRVQVDGRRVLYIARGRRPGTVCLVAPGGLGCGDTAVLHQHGLIWNSSWREGEPNRVEGVVVDTVRKVALELEDGSRLVTEPRDNAFSFATQGRPRELRWEYADGRTGSTPVTLGNR